MKPFFLIIEFRVLAQETNRSSRLTFNFFEGKHLAYVSSNFKQVIRITFTNNSNAAFFD